MFLGKPVIAVDSGGPRETVVDSTNGFLCPAIDSHFGVAMARLVKDPKFAKILGERGQERFKSHFSFEAFSKAWEKAVMDLLEREPSLPNKSNNHRHKDK